MRTVYRTGNAGSVRLSARTLGDDLSPLDGRGNRQQIELHLASESGSSLPTACAPSAPGLWFPEQGVEWPGQPLGGQAP